MSVLAAKVKTHVEFADAPEVCAIVIPRLPIPKLFKVQVPREPTEEVTLPVEPQLELSTTVPFQDPDISFTLTLLRAFAGIAPGKVNETTTGALFAVLKYKGEEEVAEYVVIGPACAGATTPARTIPAARSVAPSAFKENFFIHLV